MKKSIKILLVTLLMVSSILVNASNAKADFTAVVENTTKSEEYETLASAVSAASAGDTLKMLDNHSYETPQLIAYDIVDGYKGYLDWIEEETK